MILSHCKNTQFKGERGAIMQNAKEMVGESEKRESGEWGEKMAEEVWGGAGLFEFCSPASAKNFVEVDECKIFVTEGIADTNLSIEVAALCVEHINVV